MNMQRPYILFTAAAAIALAGCMNEDLRIEETSVARSGKGFLSLAGLDVECVADHQRLTATASGVRPAAPSAAEAVGTTVPQPDTGGFDCWILHRDTADESAATTFKLGERPDSIELDEGNYTLRIQSGEIPDAGWDAPVYGTTEHFTINGSETTALTNIVCELLNIQVSVSYPADVRPSLGSETSTTVTVGGSSLEFGVGETRSGYFRAPQGKNAVSVQTRGSYADGSGRQPLALNATVNDVRPGQHCDITLDFELDAGPADGDPTITWTNHDIDRRYTVTDDLTVDIAVDAPAGVKEFKVQIVSSLLTPEALAVIGLCDNLDLVNPEKSEDSSGTLQDKSGIKAMLEGLGFPTEENVLDRTRVEFSITQFLSMLKLLGQGTHDFVLDVTDNDGKEIEKTLMLEVSGV